MRAIRHTIISLLAAASLAAPIGIAARAMADTPAATTPAKQDGQTAAIAGTSCTEERDWMRAESGYPGVLQSMAAEALATCQGKLASK
jgi:hypothetical protein